MTITTVKISSVFLVLNQNEEKNTQNPNQNANKNSLQSLLILREKLFPQYLYSPNNYIPQTQENSNIFLLIFFFNIEDTMSYYLRFSCNKSYKHMHSTCLVTVFHPAGLGKQLCLHDTVQKD